MAKLSRTKKYADLRESLAIGREEETTTRRLQNFEDRFDSIQDSFLKTSVIEPQQSEETLESIDDIMGVIDDIFVEEQNKDRNIIAKEEPKVTQDLNYSNADKDLVNSILESIDTEYKNKDSFIENNVSDTVYKEEVPTQEAIEVEEIEDSESSSPDLTKEEFMSSLIEDIHEKIDGIVDLDELKDFDVDEFFNEEPIASSEPTESVSDVEQKENDINKAEPEKVDVALDDIDVDSIAKQLSEEDIEPEINITEAQEYPEDQFVVDDENEGQVLENEEDNTVVVNENNDNDLDDTFEELELEPVEEETENDEASLDEKDIDESTFTNDMTIVDSRLSEADISSFIQSTLDEVDEYNKSLGKTTVEEIPETMLDEVIQEKQETQELSQIQEVEQVEDIAEPEEIVVPEISEENPSVNSEEAIEIEETVEPVYEESTEEEFEEVFKEEQEEFIEQPQETIQEVIETIDEPEVQPEEIEVEPIIEPTIIDKTIEIPVVEPIVTPIITPIETPSIEPVVETEESFETATNEQEEVEENSGISIEISDEGEEDIFAKPEEEPETLVEEYVAAEEPVDTSVEDTTTQEIKADTSIEDTTTQEIKDVHVPEDMVQETGEVENNLFAEEEIIDETKHEVKDPLSDTQTISTINLEIDKIMNQISSQTNEPIIAPALEEIKANEATEELISNYTPEEIEDTVDDVVYEESAASNGEEVEILNLAELEATGTLTKTNVYARNIVDEEEYEERNLDAPNKFLNILLIVLIVALVLVLGFVVYEFIDAGII